MSTLGNVRLEFFQFRLQLVRRFIRVLVRLQYMRGDQNDQFRSPTRFPRVPQGGAKDGDTADDGNTVLGIFGIFPNETSDRNRLAVFDHDGGIDRRLTRRRAVSQ